MTSPGEKLEKLRSILRAMGGVTIAYSGGVDSTLLLKVAREELNDRASAIIVTSDVVPPSEVIAALEAARGIGIEPLVVRVDLLAVPGIRENRPDRCYICKHFIFGAIIATARERGLKSIADGTHAGDLEKDRPGRRALRELGVRSPLEEAGFIKEEIRAASMLVGLPDAQRPASPCLVTRIPFHEEVTFQKLEQVRRAEEAVRKLGIQEVRVRHHGTVARIEVLPQDFALLLLHRSDIIRELIALGFVYVDLDLRGFRSGSMSEVLDR